ncbi:hypothetical protein [Rubrivirga sp. IMCC45206]
MTDPPRLIAAALAPPGPLVAAALRPARELPVLSRPANLRTLPTLR